MRGPSVRGRILTAPLRGRPHRAVEPCRPRAGGAGQGGDGGHADRGLGRSGADSSKAAPGERAADRSPQKPETRVRRVLVVDDEPSIRLLCRVNLAASGMEVLEAGDGRAPPEGARTGGPDLILLDVVMPRIHRRGVGGRPAGGGETPGPAG